MNVKTLKRMSKRSVSVLLTVLMIISLFTVCMVGTTVTAGAADVPTLYTKIYLDAGGWESAHLFVGNSSGTTHYTLDKDSLSEHDFYVEKDFGSDYDSYFFSTADYGMNDEAINTMNIATVRTDLIGGKHACSNLISRSDYEIKAENAYTVGEGGVVDVEGSSIKNGWINATMYNYRTTNQIAAAANIEGTLTEEQNYTVDSTNGQAKPIFEDGDVYKQYNAAVADWFKNQSTNGKVKDVSVTPLYQGNIRAGNKETGVDGTLSWAKDYFNFVSVANGANRKSGASSASIKAAAQGLVDSTLSKNGTIQQNGIELPQFSDAFMNFNADSKIQSKYENLKFEAKVIKSDKGNAWYKYDSSAFGNRSLDIAKRQIKNLNKEVKGCENNVGKQNDKAGYYPFNQSQPSDTDNITNCFGTRFDIDYAMQDKTGKVKGEDMQFKFTGDDDMWVYIDGHLVLDLGGSHAMASGSINLATMQVSYTSGYYNGTYDNVTDRASASFAYTAETTTNNIPENVKAVLQDTTRTHKMTIFYMERGTFDSNLSFEFLLPQTNSLTVEQKMDTSAVNSALVKDTLQTADKDVFQTYIVSNSSSATSNNTTSVTEDFTRKDVYGNTQVLQKGSSSAAQTGTPFIHSSSSDIVHIGNTNFVWEDKNSTDTTKGKGTPKDGTVELLYNQSATFNDQFTNGSQFWLTKREPLKSFELPNLTENQPTSSENGRSRSKYYDTKLKVTDNSGSELTQNGNGSYNFGESTDNIVKVKAEYTNKVKVGSVAFKKNIEGTPDTSKYFKFKIEMRNIFGDTSDTEWKVYEGLDFTVSGIQGVKKLGSEGTVDLKHGETLTIDGVPVGTEYRITEVESGDYSVSSVTQDTDVANNSKMVSETNGFSAKLPTSGAGQTASYTVNNTKEKVTVLYRYQDRAVETGLPTDLENHYTYFTRNIAGDINSIVNSTTGKLTEDGKKKLKDSLPEVSNVLMSYSVKDDIQQNVEYRTLTDDYLNTKLSLLTNKPDNLDHTAEGVPANIQALVGGTTKVLVVTYNAVQKNYTVNLTFPQKQEDGSYAVKPSLVQGHFNSLILTNAGSSAYTAPKSYTDADDKVHTFRYWAKRVAIEGGASSNKKWVPVSTNYTYNYRITDNMELKAVYDTDVDYTQLDAPKVTVEKPITYMPTGEGTGYAAAASERIYDSYSKDYTDRTRVNVIFDAVGSADLDRDISALGYVLIKNTGSYANASEFTEADIRAALGPDSSTTKIKGHDAQIKYYTVEGRGDFNGTEYDQTGTKWNGRYNAGKVNLTNKNRANIVFDLKNTKASHNNYFTCYTVMKRGNYTYVSKSPAYFNLGEADPNVTPDTPTVDTYNISTSARYTTNGTTYISDTKAGNVSSNGVRFVKEGQAITVSYYPTSYTEGDRQYVSQLESLKIGKQTITSDDFTSFGIDPTKNGSYQFTFSKEKYLGADAAAGATLEIVASFKANTDANYITVTAPTVANGTVTIGSEYTVQNDTKLSVKKGSWFYVKATPDKGFGFTNWSVKGTSVSANPVRVVVAEDGTLSVDGTQVTMEQLTPNFVQFINVTLTSGTGGTISYSCTYNGTNVKTGTIAENSTKIVNVPAGTIFKLTANPNSGYNFTKWSSALNNSPKPVEVTTRFGDAIITAEFERVPNKTLYLKLDHADWTSGQRFAVFFGGIQGGDNVEWLDMTNAGDNLYKVEVPSNKVFSFIIFCQMDENKTENNWGTKVRQTENLTVPADGRTMFTVNKHPDGKNYDGDWSAAPDDNSITVTAPTNVANGKVYIGTDASTQELTTLTFTKGTPTSFYVKATPDTGYAFKNWTVNGTTTISVNPVTVNVAEDGTLSVNGTAISSLDKLVPTFEGGTTGDTTRLYLKLGCDKWKADPQRFYAYLSGKRNVGSEWKLMEPAGDYLYSVEVPSDKNYTKVIFCKMKNDTSAGGWGSDVQYQTDSLTIPAESGKIYTVTNQPEGHSATGDWSAAPDDNSVTVKAPTNVANGKVTIGTNSSTQELNTLTVQKGTSFYVKATPNTGFTFKNWTVNSASVSNEKTVMVSVSDTGVLSVNGTTISSLNDLVPNFEGGTTGDTTTLYLKLEHADWKAADARYQIYIFDSTDNTYNWYTMEKVDETTYKYSVPNDVINKVSGNDTNIIFVRSDPNKPEHEWGSKDNKIVWNQTKDLTIPTGGDTKFTVETQITNGEDNGKYNGKWSTP